MDGSCCGPSRPQTNGALNNAQRSFSTDYTGMVRLDGGPFLMGNESPQSFPDDGEGPVREVSLAPFWIDTKVVTNTEFAAFVDATGYVTEAEKFGWSFVFHLFLPADFPPTQPVPGAPWWRQVFKSTWRTPEGAHSNLDGRADHPVVHVSWNDAVAYANWKAKRLPTEAEWEYAARGGLEQKRYPWGDRLRPDGEYRCNIWQGQFPVKNSEADGYLGTCPVDAYKPNAFGLYNMSGNVWEWCADWFSPTYHQLDTRNNPLGPSTGEQKVMKGGSYLCHKSYCNRYRVGARTSNTPDSSTGHMGFRLVASA